MKINNVKFLFAFLSVSLIFAGCKKDYNVASKATFWPELTRNGDALEIITVGDVYTDDGAVATVNGSPIPVIVDNQVDASTPGVYPVFYSAFNTDGIAARSTRTIVVVPNVVLVNGDQIIGDFTLATPVRPSPIPTMSVEKLTTGLYHISNIYGSNGSNQLIIVPAYVYTTDGLVFNVLDASPVGAEFSNNIAFGGTATWNGVTNKLACIFNIASVGPTNFSRTWQHN